MSKYNLTIGPVELNGIGLPSHRAFNALFAAACVMYLTLVIGLMYGYAFLLPEHIGFETTLLLGVALLFFKIGD